MGLPHPPACCEWLAAFCCRQAVPLLEGVTDSWQLPTRGWIFLCPPLCSVCCFWDVSLSQFNLLSRQKLNLTAVVCCCVELALEGLRAFPSTKKREETLPQKKTTKQIKKKIVTSCDLEKFFSASLQNISVQVHKHRRSI